MFIKQIKRAQKEELPDGLPFTFPLSNLDCTKHLNTQSQIGDNYRCSDENVSDACM